MLGNDSADLSTSRVSVVSVLEGLTDSFKASILAHAQDEHVAGFKSVICYRYGARDVMSARKHWLTLHHRTGLDIAPLSTYEEIQDAVLDLLLHYKATGAPRLQQKVLNDYLVRLVLQIAGEYHKPGRFREPLPPS